MAGYSHSRPSSSDNSSNGSTGSSYQLILDHILTYPGSYEIPLRTMYTLNCAPRAQPLRSPCSSPSNASDASSPTMSQSGWQDHSATQSFAQSLMAQMSKLPSQPTSLPPSFITSFVRRCFQAELVYVDFPQALTGLDYLKDLETRRRKEVASAVSRLAIDRTTLDMDAASLGERYPGLMQWVNAIEAKERKVDALYTQVYVSLRRWILINELSLLPFNKHNCVAMLNTLYPPVMTTPPTSKLTPTTLKNQRDGYFKYITSVEKNGPHVLRNLMQQGKAEGEESGWMAVTRTLGLYLQLANSIIVECQDIQDVHDVSPMDADNKSVRKVDSGISFSASETRRPSMGSVEKEPISPIDSTRPRTASGARAGGTALEKLARGLKTMGRSRTDVTEMILDPVPSTSPKLEKTKGLRKMRSMGSIERGSVKPEPPSFNVEEMKQQRKKYDAMVTSKGMAYLSYGM